MPKFLATEDYEPNTYVDEVRRHLRERGLTHLRVRRREDVLILESGPKNDATPHARLRRISKHLWRLEMATHDGYWEPTPWREPLEQQLVRLTDEFGWMVAPRE